MKTRSPSKSWKRAAARRLWLGFGMIGLAALASGSALGAEVAKTDAGTTETNKPAEAPPELSPEEQFEGGAKTYPNWIEFGVGGFLPGGNKARAQQQHRLSDGAFGGIQDFHYQVEAFTNTTLTLDGRALFDERDYKLRLGLVRPETGFIRLKYEQFRTWYNGDGGFYGPGSVWYSSAGDALAIDRGSFSFEAGLTLEKFPKITVKFTHWFREGENSSTSWGQTHPDFTALVRGLGPTILDIDESRDIFELDVTHHIKATEFGIGVRYETGDLNNARKITQFPGEPAVQREITSREGTSYDLLSVHAFTETWIRTNLFLSSGVMYSALHSDLSGSRIYGDDFDVSYVPSALSGLGYYDLKGALEQHEYVVNLNLMAIPLSHLTIVPSVRVQKQDWNGGSTAFQTLGTDAPVLAASDSDRDTLDLQERLDLRYSGVTNWVFFARGEWAQGDGNLQENGGVGQTAPVQRKTEDRRDFQKYSAGVRWYPVKGASVDFGGYYKNNTYDYDHRLDDTSNTGVSGNRYPAYLVMQNFETLDGNLRLTLRPVQSVTLVSRYEFQRSTIQTTPDAASGLTEIETSEMTSHIFAQNVSWSPWTRLVLQAGCNYVISETKSPASQATQAVLDAQNNYWTLNFNSSLVLDEKTDLNVAYFYYQADNFQDNSAAGLPLGMDAREHGITATIVRRLTDQLRLTLRYGYFHNEDGTYGGHNNYQAHALFAGLQWRF